MSGGGSPTGPSNGGGEPFNCLTLVERTSLSSPDPEVVSKLSEGDQLQVTIGKQGDAEVLQALDRNGAVAGSLVPPSLPRFVMCIRQGVEYVAVIQQRDSGRIRVEIRPGTP